MLIYAERNQNRGCLWAGMRKIGERNMKEWSGFFYYALYCVLITQEKEMANSPVLCLRILWRRSQWLQSRSQRVGHDWSTHTQSLYMDLQFPLSPPFTSSHKFILETQTWRDSRLKKSERGLVGKPRNKAEVCIANSSPYPQPTLLISWTLGARHITSPTVWFKCPFACSQTNFHHSKTVALLEFLQLSLDF